jgi:ribosomal protein S27AE
MKLKTEMKTYVGRRDESGRAQILVLAPGDVTGRPLQHRVRHSPDGFEWGYGGSGPADTARSILFDYLGHDVPASVYQAFKFTLVAKLKQDWRATALDVDAAIRHVQQALRIDCLRCGDSGILAGPSDDRCSCRAGGPSNRGN